MISLKKSIPHLKSSTEPFYDARIIKDEKEIKILKKASKIIDEMFEICSKKMKVGQKESELQTILMTYAMEQEMFDTDSFCPTFIFLEQISNISSIILEAFFKILISFSSFIILAS